MYSKVCKKCGKAFVSSSRNTRNCEECSKYKPKLYKSKYSCNRFVGDLEGLSYFIGFVYADGHVSDVQKRIQFLSSDEQIVRDISKRLGYNRPITVQESKLGYKTIYSNTLFSDNYRYFKSIGFLANKNEWSLDNLPEVELYHFLRGLLDGDGHIATYKGVNGNILLSSINFLGREKMLLSIQERLGHGSIHNVTKDGRKELLYNLQVSGVKAYQLLWNMWNDCTISLERKLKVFEALKDHTFEVISKKRVL